MSTKGVIFDFGNVLTFFSYDRFYSRIVQYTKGAYDLDQVKKTFKGTKLLPELETGKISKKHFIDRVKEMFALRSISDDEIITAFTNIFEPNSSALEIAARIPSEIRLVLGSNTNVIHAQYMQELFSKHEIKFHKEVLSFRIGFQKPQRPFYEECLLGAGLHASQYLYFDDIPEYVTAAEKLGINGVVYTPDVNIEQELAQRGITLN